MPTEYCKVCGCVIPFCKHTDTSAQMQQAALLMMGGVDHPGIEPERMKVEYKMVNPSIIPCMTLRPDCTQYAGKFVAEGFIVDYEGTQHEFKTRTSLLVKIDIEAGYVETLNSIYWIV